MSKRVSSTYVLTRLCFQRALAFIYCLGFIIILLQYLPLLGEDGLYPIKHFLTRVSPLAVPSLFWLNHSDTFLIMMASAGLVLALSALSGLSEKFNSIISPVVWALLWFLYLSFVNVGQTFYGFGWESILLESGFLAIFLGASKSAVPKLIIWLYRWVLFRVMFGAGLIKLRGDECWLNLTCMYTHYETQPIPNPLSWYFHHLPTWIHKAEILFTHMVELVVPFAYFLMVPFSAIAGAITILFQTILIFSGNLSWLNYMTIVLCIPCFDDSFLRRFIPVKKEVTGEMPTIRKVVLAILGCLILFLSISPVINMISPGQKMNASFDPFHLVNTYGAFGSITKVRKEVIFEGTEESTVSPQTVWKEYHFKCKPGDVSRRPCVVSPYHLRLDWQIWFAAMSTYVRHPWVLNMTAKLLQGDKNFVKLLGGNPFPDVPPKYVRAIHYEYRFTTPEEKAKTGDWWVRKRLGEYLPPLSLDNPSYRRILKKQKWL